MRLATNSECQIFSRLSYNKEYNLSDSPPVTNIDKIMDSVTYKEKEDIFYTTEYYKTIDDFLRLEIYKHTGLNYNEYISLTDTEIDIIQEFILVQTDKVNKIMDELDKENDFDALNKKGKYDY